MTKAIVIKTSGTIFTEEIEGIERMQEIVGGIFAPIDLVLDGENVTLWVNDEFLFTDDDLNLAASVLCREGGRPDVEFVKGNVLLTGGADERGETLDVPDAVKHTVRVAAAAGAVIVGIVTNNT